MRRLVRNAGSGSRVRLALLLAVGAALLVAPSGGASGQSGNSCPTGFDLGGLTFDQALQLPRIQAGIAAGVGDTTGFAAFFNTIDKNGDGVVCVKTQPASSNANIQPHWLYAYNFVDDNSSATVG
jgi:hypothetical protein